MRRDEVIKRLRELRGMKAKRDVLDSMIESTEAAMEMLTEEEREIIDKMFVNPELHAADRLCEMLLIEISTVYYRRNMALKKLEKYME